MRFILSLIAAIILGALVGGAMVLLDKIGFYLILVVPVFGGAIIGVGVGLPYIGGASARREPPGLGGGLSAGVITPADDRPSRLPLIVIALIGVLVASAVYWYGGYLVSQEDNVALIQAEDASYTREEALELIDLYYASEYGTPGFVGYVQDMAAAGFSINRATSSSDSGGIVLQGTTAYIFWVVEGLVMWFMACSTAFSRARAVPTPAPAPA